MSIVKTGIDVLRNDKDLQAKYQGKVALLSHGASVDSNIDHSLEVFMEIFGKRVIKIFGPQHGFITTVQDNMIETDHFTHPIYKIPVYSLYSETRIPTDEMLEGIDHLFVDLQDVGTRIYTYIYTLTHILEKCAGLDIEVTVLDRPNPIDAVTIEGNILNSQFASFVGRHPIPVRHALTMGEVGLMHQKFWATKQANYDVIKMQNYKRDMYFEDTGLPWVMPSPNLPTVEGCFTFVGSVLFEGTNISEGRGTTRSLEIIGHPNIDTHTLTPKLESIFKEQKLGGFKLRPLHFQPTFQKHAGLHCQGYQVHVLDRKEFRPWRVFQIILKEMIQQLGDQFSYKTDPYEYGQNLNPMDMINGDDRFREWYLTESNYQFLDSVESELIEDYKTKRNQILIY